MRDRLRHASLEPYSNVINPSYGLGTHLSEAADVAVDVHKLGIDWLRSESALGDLATKPETFPYVEEVVKIWKRNDWRVAEYHYGMFKPISALWDQFTSVERLAYLANALNRREALFQKIEQAYGGTDINLTLGELSPLTISLDKKISLGGNRFNLLDGRSYREGKVKLGMVDIDYNGNLLLVNLVQDHPAIIWYSDEDDRTHDRLVTDERGEKRKLRTIISTRQRRIRDVMKRGRTIPHDPYATDSAGLEEILIYATSEILKTAGVISPEDTILIPKSEVTHWGGFDYKDAVDDEGKNGTGIALRKALARAIENQPLQRRLKRFRVISHRNDPYTIADEAFAESYLKMDREGKLPPRVTHNGVLTPLPQLLGELLLDQTIDSLRPSIEELNRLGFYDLPNFCSEGDQETYLNLMYTLAMRTPDYLRTFYPYRTAFADVTSENLDFGRTIKREDLLKLSFSQEVNINHPF